MSTPAPKKRSPLDKLRQPLNCCLPRKKRPSSSPHPPSDGTEASPQRPNDSANAGVVATSTGNVDPGHSVSPGASPSIFSVDQSSDLWSEAYREAIDGLSDPTILKTKNISELFRQLERIDKKAEKSIFVQGQHHLESHKSSLQNIKAVLDMANPLASMEPTAKTVFGVVSTVITIAISIASADKKLGEKIGEMLEKLPYIDQCDVLGQKTHRREIHDALVLIYSSLLEFYQATHDILVKNSVKFVMSLLVQDERLPPIIEKFLKHLKHLERLIEKATWEVTEEIKKTLCEQDINAWLEKDDNMGQQRRYHMALQELLAPKSCDFLLNSPEFTRWYESSDYEELLITGEMGFGKTVAMRDLYNRISARTKQDMPRPKVFYYYCRDGSTSEAVLIFRALILAILRMMKGLQIGFHKLMKDDETFGAGDLAVNTKALGQHLRKMLDQLDRKLFIVIDGLDECSVNTRREILGVFRESSKPTQSLRVLFSTRPSPPILDCFKGVRQLRISPSEQRDREQRDQIIALHTIKCSSLCLSDSDRTRLVNELTQKAQGSAIWIKMAVELIACREITELGSAETLFADLALPQDLFELYEKLLKDLARGDRTNGKIIWYALGILAVARRPLSISEISWAVALAKAKDQVHTIAELGKSVDHRRVLSLIHPFISIVEHEDTDRRQVRLVHQSVKEYVLQWQTTDTHQRKNTFWPQALQSGTESSEEPLEASLLAICMRYLLLDEIDKIRLFSDYQLRDQEMVQDVNIFHMESFQDDEDDVIHFNPAERGLGKFFTYASCEWISHFSAISQPSPSTMVNIQALCANRSVRLYNWTEQQCRPSCVLVSRYGLSHKKSDPLSIVCLFGSEKALHFMLQTANFEAPQFHDNTVMNAMNEIVGSSRVDRLSILFREGQLCKQITLVDFFQIVMRYWPGSIANMNWDPVFGLLDELPTDFGSEDSATLMRLAVEKRCSPMIKRLESKEQEESGRAIAGAQDSLEGR